MKSTTLLRLTLSMIFFFTLAMCIFAFPEMWRSFNFEDQNIARPMRGIIIGMYVSAIPFLIGLWQAWKLLGYIEKHSAFSDRSILALKHIKTCATIIAVVMASTLPLFYGAAELDDAPGIIVIGIGFVGGPIVVAVSTTVLQRLLRSAIAMKSEHKKG